MHSGLSKWPALDVLICAICHCGDYWEPSIILSLTKNHSFVGLMNSSSLVLWTNIFVNLEMWYIYIFMPPRPQPMGHRAFGMSLHPKTRLRFLSKVESQDLLMIASWYFIWGSISMKPAGIYKSHDLMTYISWSTDFGQIIKDKIFVEGRISRPINGSKSLFHLRMCIYEISRNIQVMTSWPIFHGLLTTNFGKFSIIKIFVIGRFDGSKFIFLLEALPLWDQQRPLSH